MAPLLWRLPKYGVELPAQARAVNTYAERIFSRESFQTSLTEAEREMRD
ncbi:MAG: stringent starvation protein A, partial [Gammaproteobacteria bacterium]|nr:stringent starvation protein A [Gammaproteobacteria bacterium]